MKKNNENKNNLDKTKKNLKKGLLNFLLIELLYIGIPMIFIFLAPILIPNFRVSIGLIIGIIIIGLSNGFSFFLRGYYPPKTLPHIVGGLALCIFSGLFFMYWLVIGSGIEISTDVYIAQANLGIISQIFVWTLIGTSSAFMLEVLYFFKKFKNYNLIKYTKTGFLIANLVAIGLLGLLIYQMAMTRYGVAQIKTTTITIDDKNSYQIDAYIYLQNMGIIPITNMKVDIFIYVNESSFYENGYLLGKNTTNLMYIPGGTIWNKKLCSANTFYINNTISINTIKVIVIFYGTCLGASMKIWYASILHV